MTQENLAIEFHDAGPDALGRRHFTLTWSDPDGIYREELSKEDRRPIGYRRGQVFFAKPSDYGFIEQEP